jgi:hypothetical protein
VALHECPDKVFPSISVYAALGENSATLSTFGRPCTSDAVCGEHTCDKLSGASISIVGKSPLKVPDGTDVIDDVKHHLAATLFRAGVLEDAENASGKTVMTSLLQSVSKWLGVATMDTKVDGWNLGVCGLSDVFNVKPASTNALALRRLLQNDSHTAHG